MKYRIDFFSLFSSLFLVFLGGGCEPQDQNNRVLELYVITLLSELQAEAKVTLYATKTDWELEQNPILPARFSNDQGRVRFLGLSNGAYFIDIRRDSLNNWDAKTEVLIQTQSAFEVIKELIIIGESDSGLLASAEGKRWQLKSADEFPVECLADDILVFYKGNRRGKHERLENERLCVAGDPAVRTGTWSLDDRILSTVLDGNIEFSRRIIEIKSDKLILEDAFLGVLEYRPLP